MVRSAVFIKYVAQYVLKDFHNNTFFVNMTDKEVESVHCIALVIIRLIYIDLKCVIVIGKYKEIYCLYWGQWHLRKFIPSHTKLHFLSVYADLLYLHVHTFRMKICTVQLYISYKVTLYIFRLNAFQCIHGIKDQLERKVMNMEKKLGHQISSLNMA